MTSKVAILASLSPPLIQVTKSVYRKGPPPTNYIKWHATTIELMLSGNQFTLNVSCLHLEVSAWQLEHFFFRNKICNVMCTCIIVVLMWMTIPSNFRGAWSEIFGK